MKEQFTVYLEPDLMKALTEYAERRGKPKSLVAEAAIASFLVAGCRRTTGGSPGAAPRPDHPSNGTAGTRVGISVETIALFIRFWLMATPSLPEQTQASARAKGAERYEGFVQALGRRLSKGPSFIREVSLDIGSEGATQRENEKAWTPSSDL